MKLASISSTKKMTTLNRACLSPLCALFNLERAITLKSDVRQPAVYGCRESVSAEPNSHDYEIHTPSVSQP